MAQPAMNEKRTDRGNEEAMISKEITDDGMTELYIDPVKEKILLAKLDLFFTPVIMLVYLSCFLDRTNIVRRNAHWQTLLQAWLTLQSIG
jgi:hypothetical protein